MDEATALEAYDSEGQFNVVDLATGWKADLIMRRSRTFSRTEFDRRTVVEFEGMRVPIATAEDVVLAKLEWAKLGESARQIEDAAGILRARSAELDAELPGALGSRARDRAGVGGGAPGVRGMTCAPKQRWSLKECVAATAAPGGSQPDAPAREPMVGDRSSRSSGTGREDPSLRSG